MFKYLKLKQQSQEMFDWHIVKQAAEMGDDNAMLAMALKRLINHELERLQADCGRCQRKDHRKVIKQRMDNLKIQRRKLLYHDYKVRSKKIQIYLDTIKKQN